MNTVEPLLEGMAAKYVSGALTNFFCSKKKRKISEEATPSSKKKRDSLNESVDVGQDALDTIVDKANSFEATQQSTKKTKKKLSASQISVHEEVQSETTTPQVASAGKKKRSKIVTSALSSPDFDTSCNQVTSPTLASHKNSEISHQTPPANSIKTQKVSLSPEDQYEAMQIKNTSDEEQNVDALKDVAKQAKNKKRKRHAVKTDGSDVNKRTIFVGNLPKSYSKEKLMQVFGKCGKVITARIRSVVPANPKLPRKAATARKLYDQLSQSVNGYVVFSNVFAVSQALKMNNETIDGRHIRVDHAGNVGEKVEYPHNRTVFVGNLMPETGEEEVRQHFEQCGAIEGVRVVRRKLESNNIGIAYVCFENSTSLALALKMVNTTLKGRKIRVTRCHKQEKIQAQKKSFTNDLCRVANSEDPKEILAVSPWSAMGKNKKKKLKKNKSLNR